MILFPFGHVRPEQDKLMDAINKGLEDQKYVFAHAPTGLGKTAASLSVLLPYAQEKKKKVIFLTSRLTHHRLVKETVVAINKKFGRNFSIVSLVGKRNLCSFDFVNEKNDFYEFCKKMRDENMCRFYLATYNKGKLSPEATHLISEFSDSDTIVEHSRGKFCPYEILMNLAKNADVIVCDYNYIINPDIRTVFLKKLGTSLEDTVIIFDEAHNLNKRLQAVSSGVITKFQIDYSMKQLSKLGADLDLSPLLTLLIKSFRKLMIQNIMQFRDLFLSDSSVGDIVAFRKSLEGRDDDELRNMFFKVVSQKTSIISEIPVDMKSLRVKDIDSIITTLEFYGKELVDKVKKNYVLSLARNLALSIQVDDDFFVHFGFNKESGNYGFFIDSLNPARLMNDVRPDFALFMSGTLQPVSMFKDMLGFNSSYGISLKSPFPEKNKVEIILTGATSVYSKRNIREYKKIAAMIDDIVESVPGNVLVFFPSYSFLYSVEQFLSTKKKVLEERSKMTREDKEILLNMFYDSSGESLLNLRGSVLLAVSSGNFSEGVDFSGDLLKAVVVVGIPLNVPSLKMKAEINYFNKKFPGKGQLYAYIYPALIKIMQNAGRCIRSETDKGMIFYIDSRYVKYDLFDGAIINPPNLKKFISEWYKKNY